MGCGHRGARPGAGPGTGQARRPGPAVHGVRAGAGERAAGGRRDVVPLPAGFTPSRRPAHPLAALATRWHPSWKSGRLARMFSVVQNVAIDCADAYELARFWSRVTGHPLHPEDKPGDRETQVLLAEGPVLYFNQVPEPKKIK